MEVTKAPVACLSIIDIIYSANASLKYIQSSSYLADIIVAQLYRHR